MGKKKNMGEITQQTLVQKGFAKNPQGEYERDTNEGTIILTEEGNGLFLPRVRPNNFSVSYCPKNESIKECPCQTLSTEDDLQKFIDTIFSEYPRDAEGRVLCANCGSGLFK